MKAEVGKLDINKFADVATGLNNPKATVNLSVPGDLKKIKWSSKKCNC